MSLVSGGSSLNPTMTVHGLVYHFLGVIVPPTDLWPSFLSLHIHDTDLVTKGDVRAAFMPNLNSGLLAQLTYMLHECIHYDQFFSALWDWAPLVNALNSYRMIIHSGKRSAIKHVSQYNSSSPSEIAAIIPGAEDSIFARKYLVSKRREELNANGSERIDKILVTRLSYNPLSYVFFFPTEQMHGISNSVFDHSLHLDVEVRVDSYHDLCVPTFSTPQSVWHYFASWPSFSVTLCRSILQSLIWVSGILAVQSSLTSRNRLHLSERATWRSRTHWKRNGCR